MALWHLSTKQQSRLFLGSWEALKSLLRSSPTGPILEKERSGMAQLESWELNALGLTTTHDGHNASLDQFRAPADCKKRCHIAHMWCSRHSPSWDHSGQLDRNYIQLFPLGTWLRRMAICRCCFSSVPGRIGNKISRSRFFSHFWKENLEVAKPWVNLWESLMVLALWSCEAHVPRRMRRLNIID